ncbi:hemolysin III family protein [Iamia sp. SCSIO 61187]|uniref:PAQR family membrane homeostasis protein TrhA n=1 Tax=Iamia sp. SCSIO 61187 TaxID=2722752 RepID=UPI001C62D3BC|nr:hemolysin III family protein [Iamia sp. SCSIO 61187]QYG94008.1 hemolysin III family protein [Iamia sp. SCSIO 61187]
MTADGGTSTRPEEVSPIETVDDAVSHIMAVLERPRLRGRLHLLAAVVSIGGLVWLVRAAESTEATVAAWVYGVTSLLLYATSGTYHVFARSPRARRIMQRADHSMIYLLIAGSATPAALLLIDGWTQAAMLGLLWSGAATGVVIKLVAFERFRKLGGALYIVLGWAGLLALPAFLAHPGALALMVVAGVLYTVGAILFAAGWPDISPRWFGYHEVWHVMGVTAGILLFVMNLGLISQG